MITLYFDCFFGVSEEKILGALIDCVGTYDLCEVLEKISHNKISLNIKKTVIGGIPGTKVEFRGEDREFLAEDVFLNEETEALINSSKEIFSMLNFSSQKEFYILFSVLYILSKTEHHKVITSEIFDGIGDGSEDNKPDKEIVSLMERCAIDFVVTDSPYFISTKAGVGLLSVISQACAPMPKGDIIKIGYGLGEELEGASDALRFLVVSERKRDFADVFEASLEFGISVTSSGTYANKGKTD